MGRVTANAGPLLLPWLWKNPPPLLVGFCGSIHLDQIAWFPPPRLLRGVVFLLDALGCGAGRCVLLSGGGLTSDLPLLAVFISPPLEKMSSSSGFAGAVYLLIMLLLFARPPSFLSLLRWKRDLRSGRFGPSSSSAGGASRIWSPKCSAHARISPLRRGVEKWPVLFACFHSSSAGKAPIRLRSWPYPL